MEENFNNLQGEEKEVSPQSEASFKENGNAQIYEYLKKQNAEKQAVKNTARLIAIPFIIMIFVSNEWIYLYYLAATLFGVSQTAAAQFLSQPIIQQLAQIIISIPTFLLPFICMAKIANIKIGETGYFGKPKKNTSASFFLFGAGFCAFANVAVIIVSNFFGSFGVDYQVNTVSNPEGIFGFIITLIATAAVPAMVEEFVCRGIVIGLLKKHGKIFAIIVSSLFFGLMHGNFDQIPFAIFVGLMLGYVYIKTESIWICVGIHAINNAISVIVDYIPESMTVAEKNAIFFATLIVFLLLAIFGTCKISEAEDFTFEIEDIKTDTKQKQKYKWFFTAAPVIIFTVYCLLDAFSYFVK